MVVDRQEWIKRIGTDAAALAALTVVGYGLAYLFEAGIARHFGYPGYLIELNTATLVSSLIFIIAISYAMIPFIAFSRTKEIVEKDNWVDFSLFTVMSIMWLLVALPANFSTETLWVGAVFVVVYFLQLGLMTWLKENKPKYEFYQKRKALVTVVLFGLVLFTGASSLGMFVGKNMQSFSFLKADPSYAVVRAYGSTLIAIKYDFDKAEFTNEYRVIKLPDDKDGMNFVNIKLNSQRPLKPPR